MNRIELTGKYQDYLTLKNYSDSTKKSYLFSLNAFFDFCQLHKGMYTHVTEYGKAYLVHRFKNGKAWRTVNIDYSSIRNLCVHVLGIEWDYTLIPRPKGRKQMPHVLSTHQIEGMINLTKNIKHKTILVLLYTTGIRMSELINLNISDVLFDRKQVKINLGKGGKDRIISIPQITLDLVSVYLFKYKPSRFFIEGDPSTKRYSPSSILNIVKQSAKRANVPMAVSTHSLRYAYATHHIENGTDLVTLQSQLGHSNIQTTIKYVKLCQIENRQLNHPITNLDIEVPPTII